jgi:hypothetical protein
MARASGAAHPAISADERVKQQVVDALELVNYAVEAGFRSAEGRTISAETVSRIQTTAARLGILGVAGGSASAAASSISSADWVKFELAYYNLAITVSPVTAQTLRDTAGTSSDEDWTVPRPEPTWVTTQRRLGNLVLE